MHDKSHTVYRLPVHLPEQQTVYFRPGEEQAALDNAEERDTMLTAWFKINADNPLAQNILYCDMPSHFTYDKRTRKWKVRVNNTALSRMYTVSPRNIELFHLRTLLLHVPGATSFEDIRMVDGVLADNFQQACRLRGLVQDDNEWRQALTEASTFQMPSQLRSMFSFPLGVL